MKKTIFKLYLIHALISGLTAPVRAQTDSISKAENKNSVANLEHL
jgi:hypothetical protein